MGIKDITLSENIHTITAAIENKKENFDTENKMREDLLKKISDLVQETPAEDDDEEAGAYVKIRNDIDDLLDTVGMNYYIRGIRMGAKLCLRCFLVERIQRRKCSIVFFLKGNAAHLQKMGACGLMKILYTDGKEDREEKGVFTMNIRKNHKIPGEKPVQVTYFEQAEDAAKYLDEAIDGKVVGFRDSITMKSMKLYERLSAHNEVHDPTRARIMMNFWKSL